jgi:hypothetical protein
MVAGAGFVFVRRIATMQLDGVRVMSVWYMIMRDMNEYRAQNVNAETHALEWNP